MSPRARAVVPLLLDVIIPTAGYYLLHALGVDDFWALTLAGLVTAAWAIAATIRRRRLDGVALLVVVELVLSAILLVVTRDARIVLLKPSFFTAAAGLYLLGTCIVGQPLTVETSRPLLGGDPAREAVVLHTDVATGVWASQLPGIVALVACLVFTRLRVPTLRGHVQQYLPQPA